MTDVDLGDLERPRAVLAEVDGEQTVRTLARQVARTLPAATVALTATVTKQAAKTVRATNVVVTGSLLALRIFLRTLIATSVTVSATLRRSSATTLTATALVTATVGKRVVKTLTTAAVAVTALVATVVAGASTIWTRFFADATPDAATLAGPPPEAAELDGELVGSGSFRSGSPGRG